MPPVPDELHEEPRIVEVSEMQGAMGGNPHAPAEERFGMKWDDDVTRLPGMSMGGNPHEPAAERFGMKWDDDVTRLPGM